MKRPAVLCPLLILCLSLPAIAADFAPGTSGKKIIHYGQDWPNTPFVRAHIHEMEQRPFDGIVIALSRTRQPQCAGESDGFSAFGKTKLNAADYAPAIDDLKHTEFKKFTDNFIAVEAQPADVDWFSDSDWQAVAHNLAIIAHVAREGGLKGIEFDPEEYNAAHIFSPGAWPENTRGKHTVAEYVAIARQRGSEVMRAINEKYPGIRIVFLFGPDLAEGYSDTAEHYRLLTPFIEGMCSAAAPGAQIVDGYEQSYGYRSEVAFEEGRKSQLRARDTFTDKAAFDRVMRVGFGLWQDNNSGHIPWNLHDSSKNYFQPDTWQTAMHFALSYTDEYVWVWHEKFSYWMNKNVSEEYAVAQIAARKAPGRIVADEPAKPGSITPAAQMEGHDDAATFGDLLASRQLLVSLPAIGWKFRVDPNRVGANEKWFSPELNEQPWSAIEIGKFWEEQGHGYDGVAWYRTSFKIDPVPAGKKLSLVFGAVDESATVWLNGEKIGEHDIGEAGWDKRFELDITGKLRDGGNELAVRVLNRTGPGGIWKSIKIFAEK